MTANTGIVIRKIGRIRKIPPGRPGRRNLVTRVAGKAFMLVGRMKKDRILHCRRVRRWPSRSTILPDAENDRAGSNNDYENGSSCHQARFKFGAGGTHSSGVRFAIRADACTENSFIANGQWALDNLAFLSDLFRSTRQRSLHSD